HLPLLGDGQVERDARPGLASEDLQGRDEAGQHRHDGPLRGLQRRHGGGHEEARHRSLGAALDALHAGYDEGQLMLSATPVDGSRGSRAVHRPTRGRVTMRNATYPLLALTLLAATTAGAQGEVTAAGAGSSPRLVAVHFQALPPDEFEGRVTTHVTLPPPRLGVWDSVTAAADTGCLTPLSISRDTEEGHLLLELAVRGESAALAPGESCAGTVVLRFSRGDALEAVAVGAAFYRPEDPVIVDTALRSQYSVDRLSRREASQVAPPPPAK